MAVVAFIIFVWCCGLKLKMEMKKAAMVPTVEVATTVAANEEKTTSEETTTNIVSSAEPIASEVISQASTNQVWTFKVSLSGIEFNDRAK